MASAPRACSERMATDEEPVAPTAVAATPERSPAARAAVQSFFMRSPSASSDGFPLHQAFYLHGDALQVDDAHR